jgi:hypothetical protein
MAAPRRLHGRQLGSEFVVLPGPMFVGATLVEIPDHESSRDLPANDSQVEVLPFREPLPQLIVRGWRRLERFPRATGFFGGRSDRNNAQAHRSVSQGLRKRGARRNPTCPVFDK